MNRSESMISLLGSVPVIPVIVVEEIQSAVPLAEALVEGGLPVLEVTLRTRVALEAVSAIRAAVPAAIVGVGSVIEPRQFRLAREAGAVFAVSPGATQALIDAAVDEAISWLPASQTIGEVLTLRESGYFFQKFFPAESAGGLAYLRSLGGPIQDVQFCPTGGIDLAKARSYLDLHTVRCVGGSWMCPANLVQDSDWHEIVARAREAASLRRSQPAA